MGDYKIGRDIEKLRSRIERLEGGVRGEYETLDRRYTGRVERVKEAGIRDAKPIYWKATKAFAMPPFAAGLLNLHPTVQYAKADSKSWGCTPEPLILFVTWDTGGTEEFYRFTNQVFSIVRSEDPNTGIVTATYAYTARMIAAGTGRTRDPQNDIGFTLRGPGGSSLFTWSHKYWVHCNDDRTMTFQYQFPAGLYDLVEGANWQLAGVSIARC